VHETKIQQDLHSKVSYNPDLTYFRKIRSLNIKWLSHQRSIKQAHFLSKIILRVKVGLNAVTKGLQKAGHEVDLMHLDNDRFNPVMTQDDLQAFVAHQPINPQVIDYNERLKKADHLILFSLFGGILCLQLPKVLLTVYYFQAWYMTIIPEASA
jgi:hypothetical protein